MLSISRCIDKPVLCSSRLSSIKSLLNFFMSSQYPTNPCFAGQLHLFFLSAVQDITMKLTMARINRYRIFRDMTDFFKTTNLLNCWDFYKLFSHLYIY
jgi:hypothetical protein